LPSQAEQRSTDPTRRVRVAAWVVILAIAVFQAYAQRYAVSPDGISYLDLSDAIVNRDWSRLVNLYWSPLYPALVGVARALTGGSATTEVQTMHVVNLVSFVAMFAAFDYMLMSVLELAARTRHSMLGGRWGVVGAYALFAFFSLTMLPQELTTPDLLSGFSMFAVFGALLRLRAGARHETRNAVVLGVVLGLGAFAKSFMVPWAAVCLVVLAVATRSRGMRATLISGGVWLAIVAPWTLRLSREAGRFTFGDTGRLTYVWYVNGQDAPSLGGVPPGARTARTDAILPGTGVTGPATGTDPMWFDPARWNTMLKPHWDAHQQLGTFATFQLFYVQSLTPLLFFILLVVTTPSGMRRDAWWNGWVVYVPAVAGTVAYSLVIVTARYVMPFVLAGMLTLLATLPRPRRMLPLLAVAGAILPVWLEAFSSETIYGLTLVGAVIFAMAVGGRAMGGGGKKKGNEAARTSLGGSPVRNPASPLLRVLWGIGVMVSFLIARILLPPSAPDIVRVGAVLAVVVFWFSARSAIRDHRAIRFAQGAASAMMLVLASVFALRLEIRIKQDLVALRRAASPRWGNVQQKIAADLATHGIVPGTRIALIGPHAESYWARAARVNIVANVPNNRTSAFWRLPSSARDSLLAEFAAAGATIAVASVGPDRAQPDSSWTPVRYRGWVRRLSKTP